MSKLLVAVFFACFTSFVAKADKSINSRGPYLVTQSGRVTIYKINQNGEVKVFGYDASSGKSAIQRIESEIAGSEKGSFRTSDNKAIVDWVSMKDGYTYGTMFGPPGEELFVIETSKFKNRGNPDYNTFRQLCDKFSFVSL